MAAEEIFGAVEKTIAEYKEELCRSKDLEISRLRLELKLLKAGRFELNPLYSQTRAAFPYNVCIIVKNE